MKRIKLHLHKYFFHDILALVIFIVIIIILVKLIISYNYNKQSENDYSGYDNFIYQAYEIKPSMFNFNEDNIAILKMDDLVNPITNGKASIVFGTIPLTKEQDECMGYIIVKRNKDKFDIDYSHMCDMLDY